MRTTAYHPQCNGLTERANKTFATMIAKQTNFHQDDWDISLPFVTLAYNTSIQETTGYSPAFLTFARDLKLPFDLTYSRVSTGIEAQDQYIENTISYIKMARQTAQERNSRISQKQKARYDQKRKEVSYKVGDTVLVYVPARKIGLLTKLLHRWKGPYTLTKQLSTIWYTRSNT